MDVRTRLSEGQVFERFCYERLKESSLFRPRFLIFIKLANLRYSLFSTALVFPLFQLFKVLRIIR